MIARVVILSAGLSGATVLSQMPEFSQQYAQRLGGAVDELRGFVVQFDADAASVGLDRAGALEELARGGALAQARAESMGAMVQRYERMSEALEVFQGAGPFSRAYAAAKLPDQEVARATWAAFQPAVPLTLEGGVFGGFGFLAGLFGGGAVVSVLRWAFGRRKPAGGAA